MNLFNIGHRLTLRETCVSNRITDFFIMSTDSKRSGPPSTDAGEITRLWKTVSDSMKPTSSGKTAEDTSTIGSWDNERRRILSEDYGVRVRDEPFRTDDVAALTAFDLPLRNLENHDLFITKTDNEVEKLARAGTKMISTSASEATCASWVAKLLPLLDQSDMLFCHNSEFLIPRVIPKGIKRSPRPIPWERIKPDGVWSYLCMVQDESTLTALHEVFVGSDFENRPSIAIALNAECKSLKGSRSTAQLQGIAAATLALSERIRIREKAGHTGISDLSQYFFVFHPEDIQLWRLKKTAGGQFHAWQMKLPRMAFSEVEGIRCFINVWNRLISNLMGPVRKSLEFDLQQIATNSAGLQKQRIDTKAHTSKKRAAKSDNAGRSGMVTRSQKRSKYVGSE